MNPSKMFQVFAASETLEKMTVTTGADTAGSLAGKSWKFYAKNKDGTETKYQPYYVVSGVGTDPTIGTKEVDAITFRVDVAGDYASKYFTINDGKSTSETNYYVYFTVAGAGYDPKLGKCEVSRVVTTADTARSLSGKYFTIRGGANASYYVWYSVSGGANTDPAPGGTGIRVDIISGETAHYVAQKTRNAMNAGVARRVWTITYPTAATIDITNNTTGNTTNAGAGTSGFTVSTPTAGIDAVAGLATKTLLCVVNIASGDADHVVAGKFVTAINAKWSGAAVARAPANDHIVDVTHPTRGNCTNTADGNVGGTFAVSITTGIDPTDFNSIPVAITTGDSANTVGNTTRTALQAYAPTLLLTKFGGSNNSLTVENRWAVAMTATLDVDTTWTFGTHVVGSATTVSNMVPAGAANYVIKPDTDETIYLDELVLTLSDSAVTAGGSFGALAGLTTGINLEITDKDGTALYTFASAVKTNTDFLALGNKQSAQLGSTYLVVNYNLVDAFGGEIPINGASAQMFRVKVAEALTGLDGFYCKVNGHYWPA